MPEDLWTRWGRALDPERVLPEYPRPQLIRDSHLNLNGWWDHAFTRLDADEPGMYDGRILVPFSPEAPLSEVGRQLQPEELLWYRRSFALPAGFVGGSGGRVLLHFGAVDQTCTVWLNGVEVGANRGGYLPFTCDLTEALGDGDNELVVRVRDVGNNRGPSSGKQRLHRGGIWYTAQSGIWQTVWAEWVPASYVESLVLTPLLADGAVEVTVVSNRVAEEVGSGGVVSRRSQARSSTTGLASQARSSTARDGRSVVEEADEGGRLETTPDSAVRVRVLADGREVASAAVEPGVPTRVPLTDVRPWTPEDPFLYDVEVTLGEDHVRSYVGLRSFGVGPDADGVPRLLLNGEPYLHVGVLDQGYWSDGLLTAPSDEAMVHDIETMKRLGFNVLRKHLKIEPLRWYAHCDRLGMLVWQDLVNGGERYRTPTMTWPGRWPLRHVRLRDHRYWLFGRTDPAGRAEFRGELRRTVEHLCNVTSLAVWVPFNEAWGQFDARAVADELRGLDATRVVDHASGWHDQGGGDLWSLHVYKRRFRVPRRRRGDARALVLSEYGGYDLVVDGHRFSDHDFGYRHFDDAEALAAAFLRLHEGLAAEVPRGLSATVYTQLSDVEDELNGLLTYDREVQKLPDDLVREALALVRAAQPTGRRVTQ